MPLARTVNEYLPSASVVVVAVLIPSSATVTSALTSPLIVPVMVCPDNNVVVVDEVDVEVTVELVLVVDAVFLLLSLPLSSPLQFIMNIIDSIATNAINLRIISFPFRICCI